MSTPTIAVIKSTTPLSVEQHVGAVFGALQQLLKQQLVEIQIVAATFDYKKFAGAQGFLCGAAE